ncbi:uncharacterized protein LOC120456690 isoform X1 [Drosophila santomea]|uniref:uncharacterized protein LOC120456690 isoform X1 n=2 Tax=Drosophila santomea TaxID=129105 RepID=UPI00195338C1|nr:uncharacterized protein LOC120456690 isoform X1 [Drosophila santomea]XP_039499589.1 uncharacterized protein LOC120456690 isoform X1 [Drosophila santomea]
MASNSTKKSKSSGMRILWIPGRKSHSKGRFNTTNKQISYSGPQKNSEVWSLGGSKAQAELIDLPSPDLSGNSPSSSLSIVATCSMVQGCTSSERASTDDLIIVSETATLPTTPVSPNSPIPDSPTSETATASTRAMTSPNVITTVVIQDLHNFVSPEDLPKVPSVPAAQDTEVVLNSSAGTTASIATTSSPLANHKPGSSPPASHSQQTTPQKSRYKNHNNNQEDINSIESISSFPRFQGNAIDFDWIDEMVQQRNCNELMHKNKRKKSKKVEGLDADQLDAKSFGYDNDKAKLKCKEADDNDEKVVKCLYYSLMCCDCTIS